MVAYPFWKETTALHYLRIGHIQILFVLMIMTFVYIDCEHAS